MNIYNVKRRFTGDQNQIVIDAHCVAAETFEQALATMKEEGKVIMEISLLVEGVVISSDAQRAFGKVN